MLIKQQQTERGDTLIEVILALSIFAVVTVSTLAIVNKGVAQMYDSLERTQVRMLLDRQTESLTYARDQYFRSQSAADAAAMASEPENTAAAQVWQTISAVGETTPDVDECSASSSNAFYITSTGSLLQFNAFTTGDRAVADGFPAPGNGIYVQYKNSPATAPVKFKDFYFRACWQPTSSQVPQVMSTVVRLYENN